MAKLYYSIKEVSEQIDEEQHVLRYWEKEFSILKPKKNKAGNRTYSQKDIVILFKIKDLIREQRLPVKEVKEVLKKINWNDEKDKEILKKETKVLVDKESEKNYEKTSENLTENLTENNISENKENINSDLQKVNNLTENNIILENYQIIDENKVILLGDEIGNSKVEVEFNNENITETEEIKLIEKSLNLEIDKKIVLKNHLFEDYEEFSIIPAEFVNNEKEKVEKEKNSKSNNQETFNTENEEKREEGIFVSKEKLKILVEILKEIRKLI